MSDKNSQNHGNNVDTLAKSMAKSLSSTKEGLDRFLQSLQEAGMDKGLREYRNMQAVLVQQRLWARTHNQTQLTAHFHAIAETSAKLHRLFHSYAEMMRILQDLDKLDNVTVDKASE